MYVRARDPIEQLRRLDSLKSHRTIAMRLQIIILATQGQTATRIGSAVGLTRRPVQQWVRRYNDRGVDGLWDLPRSGQPTKLPGDQGAAFKRRMLDGPTDADGVCTLRGKDAVRILADEFGAHYSLGGAISLLHRLGLSCLKPRPRHRKNDPQAMAQWEQNAPLLSTPSGASTPARPSRSGSKTKRVSVNKAR